MAHAHTNVPDKIDPVDELARAAEALRREREKLGTAAQETSTAKSVYDAALAKEQAIAVKVEEYRQKVKRLASEVG